MSDLSFGGWLKRRRAGLGLTQAELAQAIGYSYETIRKLEADKLRPSKTLASRLAEALQIPPADRAAFVRFARDEGNLPPLSLAHPTATALPTPTQRPTTALPIPATPFIGREEEAAALQNLLQRPGVRLITLTGAGGTGKTRLALQVAADQLAHFPDGVFFVNLAPIRDPQLVVPTIARALHVREAGGQALLDTLKDFLREKELLLLLDNFEQVRGAAVVMAEMLAGALRLKMLVTSREALRVAHEHVFPVPPLPLPDLPRTSKSHVQNAASLIVYASRVAQADAARLFSQRANSVKPPFVVTPDNASTIAAICHRLDGLPLALELAAARIKLLTPYEMLDRFEGMAGYSPLAMLKTKTLELPARHQALRNTIAWSYDLLDPAEQTLFRRLATFVGGWTLSAAEAVCMGPIGTPGLLPEEVLDGLESLLEKSLVQETEPVGAQLRFSMLETIREFALEQLMESGEAEAVQQQHAEFFLSLAEQAEQEMVQAERVWLARLQPEVDNLRVALTWARHRGQLDYGLRLAAAVWPFWRKQGYGQEGRRWLDEMLAHSQHLLSPARARALYAAAYAALTYLDIEAIPLFEATVATCQALGDKKGLATALGWLACSYREDRFDLARLRAQEAVAIARETGDLQTITDALHRLGDTAFSLDDMDTAQTCYEEALALDRQLGDQANIAYMLYALGHIAMRRSDLPLARSRYEQALAIWDELGDQMGLSWAFGVLAYLLRLEGDYSQARALSEQALALNRRLDRKGGISHQLENLGRLELREGKLDTAEEVFSEALLLLHQVNDKRCAPHALEALAELAMAQGQRERAARLFGCAEAARKAVHNRLLPRERAEYDSKIAAAGAYLDEPAFATAWAEGEAMSLEQAIAYALKERG